MNLYAGCGFRFYKGYNMTNKDKCIYCGSCKVTDCINRVKNSVYECETVIFNDGGSIRTVKCYEREVKQLKKQLRKKTKDCCSIKLWLAVESSGEALLSVIRPDKFKNKSGEIFYSHYDSALVVRKEQKKPMSFMGVKVGDCKCKKFYF